MNNNNENSVLNKPVVSDRSFKWVYTILLTGIAAILNYCFDIPRPILSGINLLVIAAAAYKIADQYICLKSYHQLIKRRK